MNKKKIALLLTCVLLLCCVVGGTMAWLTATTEEVVNTFTIGDINIELLEHDYVPETQTLNKEADPVKANTDYLFVPGDTLPKDPFVTVEAGSEACYLFIKVEELNNSCEVTVDNQKITVNPILDWTHRDVWTVYKKESTDTVTYLYKKVDAATAEAGATWFILEDDQITVSEDVIKEMVPIINAVNSTVTPAVQPNLPKLLFDACAVQLDNLADEVAPAGATEEQIAAVEAENIAAAFAQTKW